MGLKSYEHLHLRFSTFPFWRYVTLCSYLALCEMRCEVTKTMHSESNRHYKVFSIWNWFWEKFNQQMHRIAAGLLGFASGNQLTINTTIWAEFSRIFSKKCKSCSVFFLPVLKTAWSTKPKRQHEYHYPISEFYFFILFS